MGAKLSTYTPFSARIPSITGDQEILPLRIAEWNNLRLPNANKLTPSWGSMREMQKGRKNNEL